MHFPLSSIPAEASEKFVGKHKKGQVCVFPFG